MWSSKFFKELAWMVSFLFEIYKENTKSKNMKIVAMLEKITFYMDVLFKLGAAVYFGCVLLYIVYPIYVYFFEHKIMTIFPYQIPGIDPQTANGYLITTAFQLFGLITGFFGISSSDFFFSLIVLNIPVFPHIIGIQIEELNALLNKENQNVAHVRQTFFNLLLMHREMSM